MTKEEKQSYKDRCKENIAASRLRSLEYRLGLDEGALASELGNTNMRAVLRKAMTISRAPNVQDLSPEERPPKKPAGSYLRFISATRLNPKEGSKAWKRMTEEEKKVYADPARVDLEEWSKRYNAFIVNADKDILDTLNASRTMKGTRKIVLKSKGRYKKMPGAAYFRFYREYWNSLDQSKPHSIIEVNKEASKIWRNMSDEEKAPYIEARNKDFEEYFAQREASQSNS
ncbi:hypothetical protein BXZ70DRAFT_742398 [Cristinia sonorae]|uniref:HMG box domain-containing protein n=1 Tax=Cristinia sonorae TaxID=1940300 RepID=A0A8K0XSD1_9AGAR|nr:hypothetical protein BXZ70DRAFT_742398 [Cristinia sonorae]